MNFLSLGRKRLLTLAVMLLFASSVIWWVLAPMTPPSVTNLEIQKGRSLIQIANALESKKIIRSALAFKTLARLSGQEKSVHAGTYQFSLAASPSEILARLVAGDVVLTHVTIPEGFNLQQIVDRLADQGVANASQLMASALNPTFLAQLNIQGASLEGYLFPETYSFAPGVSSTKLLKMMVMEFNRQYGLLQKQLGSKLPLTKHQLVTLASIIQRETGRDEEMPLISSVFYNRLQRKIPLQTDPAVIYGIANFNGNLTRLDLKRPSPYNTYLNQGLPPGPISSPGYKALLAAAQPAKSKLLYFVARGDGSHQFSKTLKEHNQAVRKYQLRRKR